MKTTAVIFMIVLLASVVAASELEDLRSAGFWKHQFRAEVEGKGKGQINGPDLISLLSGLTTIGNTYTFNNGNRTDLENALDVFYTHEKTMEHRAEAQCLAMQLNQRSGLVLLNDLVDIDKDGVGDMTFSEALTAARDNYSTDPETAKDLCENIQLIDKSECSWNLIGEHSLTFELVLGDIDTYGMTVISNSPFAANGSSSDKSWTAIGTLEDDTLNMFLVFEGNTEYSIRALGYVSEGVISGVLYDAVGTYIGYWYTSSSAATWTC